MITATVENKAEVFARLDALVNPMTFRAGMRLSSEAVIKQAQIYPAPSRKPYPFVSEKQRRYVIMAIRKGIIQVPYRRRQSSGLGGAWSFRLANAGSRVESIITNATPYGHWVMHPTVQARYHQGTWPTTDDVAQEALPRVTEIWEKVIIDLVNGA